MIFAETKVAVFQPSPETILSRAPQPSFLGLQVLIFPGRSNG